MEAGWKDVDDVDSPVDLKPQYYFGVTVDDLRQAAADDEEQVVQTGATMEDPVRVTTPPPDVVPSNSFRYSTDKQSPDTTLYRF